MHYCTQCGAELTGSRYCGQCGSRIEGWPGWRGSGAGAEQASAGGLGGFSEHQLGAAAYLTPIPAMAFLIFEPYSRNRFVRFHSYQCLLLTLAAIILTAFTWAVSFFAFLQGLLSGLFQMVLIGMWILAAVRAWQGHELSLPVIGAFASCYARDRY